MLVLVRAHVLRARLDGLLEHLVEARTLGRRQVDDARAVKQVRRGAETCASAVEVLLDLGMRA
jgi:hypothetical protein